MVLSLDQDCEYRYVLVRRTIKTNHTNTYDGRWRRVSRRYGIPLMGLILSTTVCSLLGLIYFGRYVCPKPFFLWMYSNEKKKKKKKLGRIQFLYRSGHDMSKYLLWSTHLGFCTSWKKTRQKRTFLPWKVWNDYQPALDYMDFTCVCSRVMIFW